MPIFISSLKIITTSKIHMEIILKLLTNTDIYLFTKSNNKK